MLIVSNKIRGDCAHLDAKSQRLLLATSGIGPRKVVHQTKH